MCPNIPDITQFDDGSQNVVSKQKCIDYIEKTRKVNKKCLLDIPCKDQKIMDGRTDRRMDTWTDMKAVYPLPPPTTHKPCEGLQTQFVGAHKFVAGAIITI